MCIRDSPDTIVPEDCFDKCLAFFKMNGQCGALGVRMIDGSGEFLKESKRSFPSPLTSLFKITGLAAVFPKSKSIAKYYAGHLPQNKTNEVEVLAGAFMMLTKKTLEKTGGFDEKFFMYGEDIDLSYRIKNEGIKIYYFADATIIHFKGESTHKLSAAHIHNFYGAMRLFVKKHYSQKKALSFSMQAAIAFSVFLSTVTLFFKKIFAGFKKRIVFSSSKNNTLVVGTHQSFNKLIQILKFAKPPKTLMGRISTHPQDEESKIGVIKNIDGVIRHNHIDEIIFCEEGVGFKKIISITEGIKEKSFFLYHATGSTSIVGSNCKKQQGDYIAVPPQLNSLLETKAAMPL